MSGGDDGSRGGAPPVRPGAVPWRDRLDALVRDAPPWMRELAAGELFIGGFTQVRLSVPVLSLGAVRDEDAAGRAADFFLAACLGAGARVARVECADAGRAARLVERIGAGFAGAVQAIDADNAALMGYFDVYLAGPGEVTERDAGRIVTLVERAVRG